MLLVYVKVPLLLGCWRSGEPVAPLEILHPLFFVVDFMDAERIDEASIKLHKLLSRLRTF